MWGNKRTVICKCHHKDNKCDSSPHPKTLQLELAAPLSVIDTSSNQGSTFHLDSCIKGKSHNVLDIYIMQSVILESVSTAVTGKHSIIRFHFPPFWTGWSILYPIANDKLGNTLVTKGAQTRNTLFIAVFCSSHYVDVGTLVCVCHCCLSFFFNANWPPASDLQ